MNALIATLDVPGATLHDEVRGDGPVLLMICGGVYDAAGYAGLADQLADRCTVVTYDRRGNSRSPWPARRKTSASRCTPMTRTASSPPSVSPPTGRPMCSGTARAR
jgi:hypothetical protein